jgi:hypothetical protein
MEIIATAAMPWEPTPVNTRGGRVSRKILREGELLPGLGFYARLVKYHPGDSVFTAPRHKHNYDQIRYTISGTQDFGQGQVSQAGWPSYFPSGAPYGPERIEDAEVIVIQWGPTWIDAKTSDATVAELKKAGEFKNGIYTVVGEDGVHRNTDSIQAIWEKVWGRKLEWPRPKYPQPILMDPGAFDWIDADGEISVKPLGTFTEQDLNIKVLRWNTKADLEFPPDRTSLLFSLSGEIVAESKAYPAQTAILSGYGQSETVTGLDGAEAVVFGFPKQLTASRP